MLALQDRFKNNLCCCYSLFSFCLIKKKEKIKKIRTASPHATRPPRIFILPAPERCLLLTKAGFVTGKDLNLFNRCFKLGVGDQLVYFKVSKMAHVENPALRGRHGDTL